MYTLYIVYHCGCKGYVRHTKGICINILYIVLGFWDMYIYIYYKVGRNAKIKIKIHTYILYILYYTYIRRITYLHTKKGTQ